MTVYLDVILIENLCMNYIILFATGLINKSKISQIRLLLSSLLGSSYAIMSYIILASNFSNIIIKVLLSVAMVYLAFNPRNIKILLKYLIIFYLTSFAFGGCAFFLLYFVRPQDVLVKNGMLVGTYPIKIALLGGIVGFTIINIAFKVVKGRISKKDMFCEIEVFLLEKSLHIKAMLDTGNLLKEPISGVPVVVVEKEILKKIIPLSILHNMESIIQGEVECTQEFGEYGVRLRVVPFTSLGKENGMLLGIKADRIVVNFHDDIYTIDNVIIGIYSKSLNNSGKYNAIIGLDVLQNPIKTTNRKLGEEHEFITNTKV